MNALSIQDTIVLNKELSLPRNGLICAHPGRVKRIAEEFLQDVRLHTDYRGYQIYTGTFEGKEIFVANTGIGAPAAAFLIEELVAFGAKKIIRLGSNDSSFEGYKLSLVRDTSLPSGLIHDYGVKFSRVSINDYMDFVITLKAVKFNIALEYVKNYHVDGYYAGFRNREGSSDMETGALYLLGRYHQLRFASILMSYPKHGIQEYGEKGKEIEEAGIQLALSALAD